MQRVTESFYNKQKTDHTLSELEAVWKHVGYHGYMSTLLFWQASLTPVLHNHAITTGQVKCQH